MWSPQAMTPDAEKRAMCHKSNMQKSLLLADYPHECKNIALYVNHCFFVLHTENLGEKPVTVMYCDT
jgi:hypothetical protein